MKENQPEDFALAVQVDEDLRNAEALKYPFDENLVGKEDRYWATEQIKNGYNIIYIPYFIVKHHYTDNGATWKGVG